MFRMTDNIMQNILHIPYECRNILHNTINPTKAECEEHST